jgi:hypothetical protein
MAPSICNADASSPSLMNELVRICTLLLIAFYYVLKQGAQPRPGLLNDLVLQAPYVAFGMRYLSPSNALVQHRTSYCCQCNHLMAMNFSIAPHAVGTLATLLSGHVLDLGEGTTEVGQLCAAHVCAELGVHRRVFAEGWLWPICCNQMEEGPARYST